MRQRRCATKFHATFPTRPRRKPIRRQFPITAMAFTPDGSQLVVGGYHELLIWDPTTGTLVARVGNIPQRTFGMAFSPDSSWLAVAGGSPGVSGEVRLIPWQSGPKQDAEPKVLATHDDVFFDVAFRPDGQQLAAAGADGSVRVFEVATGVERLKINSHADWVTDVCFSPDGKRIATASRDKTAKVFDAETGSLARHPFGTQCARPGDCLCAGRQVGDQRRRKPNPRLECRRFQAGRRNDRLRERRLRPPGQRRKRRRRVGRSKCSTIQIGRPIAGSFAHRPPGMGSCRSPGTSHLT